MEAPSHVVFGLAGAVVIDSAVHHFTGPALIGGPAPTADTVAIKVIYYAFAALGAISPDIDNARSTIGRRAGFVSKGIQHLAGHRTLFHSILGMALVGMFIWITQYVLGLTLLRLGLPGTAYALAAGLQPGLNLASGLGIAFAAFLVGYFLHLVADSLTLGGVPWLWPDHTRFGFPPNRKWRFKSGSRMEPVVVVTVAVLVIVGVFTHTLRF
ncbi:MAG TPA: metal-dependent hydrolase [Ktedonobacterales bacterium]|nr:metal-dependent hydrolase [Ktedonobacterales bacterium]